MLTDLHYQFAYTSDCLTTIINGTYSTAPPLSSVTIAGAKGLPSGMSLSIADQPCEVGAVALTYENGTIVISGLETFTPDGAWEGPMSLELKY